MSETGESAETAETREAREAGACLQCGRGPAAELDLRAHTGMVFVARYSRVKGRFCRQCGIALFRDRMNHTLLLGWWGVLAFFLNFYAVYKNLVARRRAGQLPEPQGEPDPSVGGPFALGWPVYFRPGMAAVVAMFILGNLVLDASEPEKSVAGKCVDLKVDGMKVVPCDDVHDGMVLNMASDARRCAEGSDHAVRLRRELLPIACVDLDR